MNLIADPAEAVTDEEVVSGPRPRWSQNAPPTTKSSVRGFRADNVAGGLVPLASRGAFVPCHSCQGDEILGTLGSLEKVTGTLPCDINWDNWARIFTDVTLWRAPVRDVLSRIGLEIRSMEAGYPGTSAAFVVESVPLTTAPSSKFVVKFYPPMAGGDFAAEVEVRKALLSWQSEHPVQLTRGALPVPALLATGVLHDKIDWPYTIEECMPGQAARQVWDSLPGPVRQDVARQVAGLLRTVHSTPRSKVPSLDRSVVEWRAWARDRLAGCVHEMTSRVGLTQGLLRQLTQFLEQEGKRTIDSVDDGSLRLLHGDMTEDHVLVEPRPDGAGISPASSDCGMPQRWQVTGLIDFGDALVGPLPYEWVTLWFGLFRQDGDTFDAFIDSYLDSAGEAREAPEARPGSAYRQESRTTLLVYTLMHQFSWAIIGDALRRQGIRASGDAGGPMMNDSLAAGWS